MTERQMRELLNAYCEKLDAERARQSAPSLLRRALFPAAIGAGLLVGGCTPAPMPQPYLALMPPVPDDAAVGSQPEDSSSVPSSLPDGGAEPLPQPDPTNPRR